MSCTKHDYHNNSHSKFTASSQYAHSKFAVTGSNIAIQGDRVVPLWGCRIWYLLACPEAVCPSSQVLHWQSCQSIVAAARWAHQSCSSSLLSYVGLPGPWFGPWLVPQWEELCALTPSVCWQQTTTPKRPCQQVCNAGKLKLHKLLQVDSHCKLAKFEVRWWPRPTVWTESGANFQISWVITFLPDFSFCPNLVQLAVAMRQRLHQHMFYEIRLQNGRHTTCDLCCMQEYIHDVSC